MILLRKTIRNSARKLVTYMNHQEIERKFLIDGFPEQLPLLELSKMEQGYLSTAPTVRIRKKEADGICSYRLCFKGTGGLSRTELELDITAEQYTVLCTLLDAPPVCKEQRVYALADGHRLECNFVDAGSPTAFYYAEVEFESIDAAHAFVPPDFLGAEKTADGSFSMSAYWEKRKASPRAD